MSLAHCKIDYLTEQDYLEGEKLSEIKHEYIDGEVYAMAGASKNHQRLITKLVQKLANHLDNTPCEVFNSDIKVRADNGKKYFYPDVLVVCSDDNTDDYYTESPRIIVEVLSKATRKFDNTLKRHVYQAMPSLEEYVLIEQDFVEIEVCRKAENWQPSHYYLGDDLSLTSIGLTLPVLDIYQRVDNEDMRDFMKLLNQNEGTLRDAHEIT